MFVVGSYNKFSLVQRQMFCKLFVKDNKKFTRDEPDGP